MQKLTKEEVSEILSRPPEIEVINQLLQMSTGEGVLIKVEDWHKQTKNKCHPSSYLANRVGKGSFSVTKVEEGYLIVKK
jgi:hypothetical protein